MLTFIFLIVLYLGVSGAIFNKYSGNYGFADIFFSADACALHCWSG